MKNGDFISRSFNTGLSVINVPESRDMPFWGRIYDAESRVEVVDEQNRLCRVKNRTLADKSKFACSESYMILTNWFRSSVLKVDYIKGGYVYFTPDQLQYNTSMKCNSLDYDFGYAKQYPRFKFCNTGEAGVIGVENGRVRLSGQDRSAYICKYGSPIKIYDTELENIVISDLHFLGASDFTSKAVIDISYSNSDAIKIDGCSFTACQNDVVAVVASGNVCFSNNTVRNVYKNGVTADNRSDNFRVVGNSFSNIGLLMQQTFAIKSQGQNYYIANNIISDFGYSAITVGVWYSDKYFRPCAGIVENNEIYHSKDYADNIKRYGLMDSGAIYVASQNERCNIRNNYIHDIAGVYNNRGIFCDGGARNFTISGNVITNISAGRCIDSWRDKSPESSIGATNTGNVIADNIVDGQIRFEGNDQVKNNCRIAGNYVLVADDSILVGDTINNVDKRGASTKITYTGEKKGRIGINRKSYALVKKNSNWKSLKRYLILN